MMKMSGSCCVALIFALTSVSAVQRLHSIDDLRGIFLDQSVPAHSLILLHWLANAVDIDYNNIIWMDFDPDGGDYGAHHYGNYEGMLDPLPRAYDRYQYYSVGNLHQETSMPLPDHVEYPPAGYDGRNLDRLIVRVREQNNGNLLMIDQVYLTQHYDNPQRRGEYDPDHTYRISTNLLRQIREFSDGLNQQQLLQLRNRYGGNHDVSHIRNTWGNHTGLGLLLLIVIQRRYQIQLQSQRVENRQNNWNCVDIVLALVALFVICAVVIYLILNTPGTHRPRW